MVRPVILTSTFEEIPLILFSTLSVSVQDSHPWSKVAIVVDRHRRSRSFSGTRLSVSDRAGTKCIGIAIYCNMQSQSCIGVASKIA